MPPHITVLYPFEPPGSTSTDSVAKLDGCLANAFRLNSRFTTQSIPEHSVSLQFSRSTISRITKDVWTCFQPIRRTEYFHDVIPHFDIAHAAGVCLRRDRAEIRREARDIHRCERMLRKLSLWETIRGRWVHAKRRFPLVIYRMWAKHLSRCGGPSDRNTCESLLKGIDMRRNCDVALGFIRD